MDMLPTPFEALKAALDAAGSQSELARICGVQQPTVWKWLQSSKRLPAEHVLRVETATGVPRHHLRPDIYPADLGPSVAWEPVFCGVDFGLSPVTCERGSVLQFAQPFDGRTSKATGAGGASNAPGQGRAA